MKRRSASFLSLMFVLALSGRAVAQDGAEVFRANCASCHGTADGPQPANAPSVAALRQFSPEAILNALLNGKMRIQGTPLERRRPARRRGVSGRTRAANAHRPESSVVACKSSPPFRGAVAASDWNGWGNGIENTRFARNGGLTAGDLPKLTLKWAFGYADVTSARAQPALGRQPPVRRQRQRRRPCARPADRMRLLVVPRGSHRAHGAPRRAIPPAGRRQRMGGVLRRSEGQRVRGGRDERPSDLDPQDRRASICRHHRDAHLPRRSCLRAGPRPQRGSAGRTAAVRMLHVPRQRRPRSTPAPGRSSGRRTPSASGNRAARMPRANHSGALPAAASGRRRPSTFVAARCTSAPATDTPTLRSR